MKVNSKISGDNLSPTENSRGPPNSASFDDEVFKFLDFPAEIRSKIYGYLLPPRTHTIVTQYPHNGFFYNTATIPVHSAQSFYPFGRAPPHNRLTTYKVLNSNFRDSFPSPSIHCQILRVCKQIKEEAEPVMYGGGTVFDFGIHLDAVKVFFGDRSALARASVRDIRIAKEIPEAMVENSEVVGTLTTGVDEAWKSFCTYITSELPNLRTVDLTIWSSSKSPSRLPLDLTPQSSEEYDQHVEEQRVERQRLWSEWEWTRELLQLQILRSLNVTWWGFNTLKGEGGFDSWLAKRMVSDSLAKDRMVRNGIVIEGFRVITGKGQE